eukprot:scaffold66775_cov50-Prasinocladus_malaysianus.AAC.1
MPEAIITSLTFKLHKDPEAPAKAEEFWRRHNGSQVWRTLHVALNGRNHFNRVRRQESEQLNYVATVYKYLAKLERMLMNADFDASRVNCKAKALQDHFLIYGGWPRSHYMPGQPGVFSAIRAARQSLLDSSSTA